MINLKRNWWWNCIRAFMRWYSSVYIIWLPWYIIKRSLNPSSPCNLNCVINLTLADDAGIVIVVAVVNRVKIAVLKTTLIWTKRNDHWRGFVNCHQPRYHTRHRHHFLNTYRTNYRQQNHLYIMLFYVSRNYNENIISAVPIELKKGFNISVDKIQWMSFGQKGPTEKNISERVWSKRLANSLELPPAFHFV